MDGETYAERMVRESELAALIHQKERTHRRIAIAQLCAFLLILGISLLGWYQIEQESNERCEAGRVNRQALIDNVYAIETLGTNLVLGGADPSSPTPEQQAALDEFAKFRDSQLAKLSAPICAGEVEIDLTPPGSK